jgi:hypothetical protein
MGYVVENDNTRSDQILYNSTANRNHTGSLRLVYKLIEVIDRFKMLGVIKRKDRVTAQTDTPDFLLLLVYLDPEFPFSTTETVVRSV